jgi:hypothetical protein
VPFGSEPLIHGFNGALGVKRAGLGLEAMQGL